MKTLRLTALAVVLLTLLVRGYHKYSPLPDWAVRINGIIMLAGAALLVFASVRLTYKQHTKKEE